MDAAIVRASAAGSCAFLGQILTALPSAALTPEPVWPGLRMTPVVPRNVRVQQHPLRTGEFLDAAPPPRNVPAELVEWVWDCREVLRAKWDEKYPENVVFSKQEDR
ncbi:MAG: hypothetical protein ACJ8GN_12295 [Longimicrobiaceae bacterium]